MAGTGRGGHSLAGRALAGRSLAGRSLAGRGAGDGCAALGGEDALDDQALEGDGHLGAHGPADDASGVGVRRVPLGPADMAGAVARRAGRPTALAGGRAGVLHLAQHLERAALRRPRRGGPLRHGPIVVTACAPVALAHSANAIVL